MPTSLNVAVLLAGAGHLDGSEIRESVLALLALDRCGASWQCVAPNAPQAEVDDHATRSPVAGAPRNMLEEASRISRAGKCLDLAKADPNDFGALIIPGGLGTAKSLFDYHLAGNRATVRPDVMAFVSAFFAAGKPVGAICIAPVLVALCLAKTGHRATVTLGGGADREMVEKLGTLLARR